MRIWTLWANRQAMAASPTALLERGLLVASGFVIAVSLCVAAGAPQGGSQHIVIIKQMRFQPPKLNVKVGDTVEWKNEDIFKHSVTANDGSFDSGLIAPEGSWQTTMRKNGTIVYHCGPHPNMTAQVIAQQPSGAGLQEHSAP